MFCCMSKLSAPPPPSTGPHSTDTPARTEGVVMRHLAGRKATARLLVVSGCLVGSATPAQSQAGNQPPSFLSDVVDVSRDYGDFTNAFYVADRLTGFDPATASGQLTWVRNQLVPLFAFDNMSPGLKPFPGAVFPAK